MDHSTAIIDIAYEKLIQILDSQEHSTHQTEADTRLRVIDRILIEALGWPQASIDTESQSEAGRLDYILNGAFEKAVVEAKRSGDAFDIDLQGTTRASYKVNSPVLRSGSTGTAMHQVEEYARARGIG